MILSIPQPVASLSRQAVWEGCMKSSLDTLARPSVKAHSPFIFTWSSERSWRDEVEGEDMGERVSLSLAAARHAI